MQNSDSVAQRQKKLMQKFETWIAMARAKHAWSAEVKNSAQVLAALDEEIDEFRRAVRLGHPVEHQVSELLDAFVIILRALCGEHLTGVEAEEWLRAVFSVEPTPIGVTSPWDEHKGGAICNS